MHSNETEDAMNMNMSLHESEDFSPLHLLTILFRRKKIVLACLLSFVGIAVAVNLLSTPVYRASSTILLEREDAAEKTMLLKLNQPPRDVAFEWVTAEIEIMRSYPVAERIIREQAGAAGFADLSTFPAYQLDDTVRAFQKALSIRSERNSNVVEVNFEDASPAKAVDVVKKVIATYVDYRADISRDSEAYRFYEEQLTLAGEKLRELEEQQSQFKQKQNLVSTDQQKEILLRRLADYQQSLTAVRTKRITKDSRLQVIRKQLESGEFRSIPSIEVSNSPSRERHIAKLKGDRMDLELRRQELMRMYTPKFELVQHIDNKILEVDKQISSEVTQIIESEEASIEALRTEEQVLEAAIAGVNREVQRLSAKEYEFNQISRGISDTEEVYSMLLKQREEARLSLAKLEKGVKIKTINPAIAGKDPVFPRTKLFLVVAIALGLVFGVGLALVQDYFDHSISTPAELESYTGLPVLGAVAENN